jgi:hypothetical protein
MAMPQAQKPILDRIRKALHVQYDETVREPLPERWVDLIRYLNEKDQMHSEAGQRRTDGPSGHKIQKN